MLFAAALLILMVADAVDFSGINLDGPTTPAPFKMVGDISHSMEEFYDSIESEGQQEASSVMPTGQQFGTTTEPTSSGQPGIESSPENLIHGAGADYPAGLLAAILAVTLCLLVASLAQFWVMFKLLSKVSVVLANVGKGKELKQGVLRPADVELGL
ncbi:hypothetical protein FOL47_007578 [Perkinsus chesapeaki]|uniref:Uncharacterized protein n=1 Tax=Perkinsus chesapeaki TaxID=330153 RepID=A0A7J6LJK1_PERCH|nr:hypothetical protein FOL47_007578 [Perkinsus chesapeaki]